MSRSQEIASTIVQQIKRTGNIFVVGSWGVNFKKLSCGEKFGIIIDSEKNETLSRNSLGYLKMKTKGAKHKGDIYILLMPSDEYTIIAAKTTDKLGVIKTKIVKEIEGVYWNDLVEILDSIIEK
jgi:hypothetical protein